MAKKRKVKVVVRRNRYDAWAWEVIGGNGSVIGKGTFGFYTKHNARRSAKLLGLPIEIED
jgi:hypothetical protein